MLQNLRIDFAQVYWFRQLCIANVDGVYNHFVKSTKKLINNKEVENRMIDIVQSGLGSFSYNNGKILFTFDKCKNILITFIYIYTFIFNFQTL